MVPGTAIVLFGNVSEAGFGVSDSICSLDIGTHDFALVSMAIYAASSSQNLLSSTSGVKSKGI